MTEGTEYDPSKDPAVSPLPMLATPRSSKWPACRAAHLEKQPCCAACGTTTALEVHHIQPFHDHPERELDPNNLITLCECPSHNCHLLFGHALSWRLANKHVVADAKNFLSRMVEARSG